MSLIDDLILKLEDAQRIAALLKGSPTPGPITTTVKAGANLQALLDIGGNYELEPGAAFAASRFVFHKPVRLSGLAQLIGTAGPAIHVTPGANGIVIDDVECIADGYGDCIQLGNNDTSQTRLDQVPQNIVLTRVLVRSHNRKRAVGINSTKTQLIDCDFLDVWDRSTAHADSHPWAIMNTPGDISIIGGNHSGGSELGIIGGDTMRVMDNGKLVIPTNIFIGGTPEKNLVLFRPLEWMDDGMHRAVKCGLELKTGHNVVVKHVTIKGNWQFAQPDAFAIQLTPKSGGSITNILMEDIIVEDSPSFMGVTAYDPTGNPTRTTGIKVNRVKVTLDKIKYRGGGKVFQLQGGIGTLDVNELEVSNPAGNSFLYSDKVKTERINITNCKGNLAKYRFMLGGEMDGLNWKTYVDSLIATGNIFSESSALFRKNFPLNVYS